MQKVIHRADERGQADHGWLKARHSFSFAGYLDRNKMGFGLLRVINDDEIAAGGGFGDHPHDNMEIVTIPMSGALRHKDSMGHEETIQSGEVQRMSAGTGIVHSEFNPSGSEATKLLQIWVQPKEQGIEPSYEQKKFSPEGRKNKIQYLVAPDRRDQALWINQNAYFSLSDLDQDTEVEYKMNDSKNGLYVFVKFGKVSIADESLSQRDAMGLTEVESIKVNAQEPSEILFIEVPMG